jgi:hypothetical protein
MASQSQPLGGLLDAMSQRCKPFKVGLTLILLLNAALTLQLLSRESPHEGAQLFVLITLYVASAITVFMMYSMCESMNVTAAWMTVLFAPFIIGVLAFQIDTIAMGLLSL